MRISAKIVVAALLSCALAAVAAGTSLALSGHKPPTTTSPRSSVPSFVTRSKGWLQPFSFHNWGEPGWNTFLLPAATKLTTARPASLNREVAISGEVSCARPTLTGAARVVGLTAQRVACAKAMTLAGVIARQLAQTGSVSVPEAASLEMSSSARCGGCVGTTEVRVLEPNGGEVTVTVRGKTKNLVGAARLPLPSLNWPMPFPIPMPLPAPASPAPSSGGEKTLV